MNSWTFIRQSVRHFWAIHLSMALAVAITTAVITGALTVGDSMRGSLKGLTLKRLGPIDHVMTSQSFFQKSTYDQWIKNEDVQKTFPQSSPGIFFPAATLELLSEEENSETEDSGDKGSENADSGNGGKWGSVSVWGTTQEFWTLDWADGKKNSPSKLGRQEIVLNQTAADLLELKKSDVGKFLSLRIGKPSDVPAESFISTKEDRVQLIARLKLVGIIPDEGLGRFSLIPSVQKTASVYVSAETLQRVIPRAIRQSRGSGLLFNAVLLAKSKESDFSVAVPDEQVKQAVSSFVPKIEDAGFRLKKTQIKKSFRDGAEPEMVLEYWNLTSSRMMLDPGQWKIVEEVLKGKSFRPVLTYLANEISISPNQDQESSESVEVFPVSAKGKNLNQEKELPGKTGIPFSMIAASNFRAPFSMTDQRGKSVPDLKGNQILLNQWAANDLGVKEGQWVRVKFYEPVSVDGDEKEFFADFQVAGITGLRKPNRQFRRRGRQVIPAVFYDRPFPGNDPDLTPEVPGVTDAASISAWNLPFETADKIRPQDDDYWKWYRTTPKAFISLKAGQNLWDSRFGNVTGVRIPAGEFEEDELRDKLASVISRNKTLAGIRFQAVKKNGLTASGGSTPFDVLFLMLSMFVVLSALILLSLFFRLGLQHRSDQIGLLFAMGFDRRKVLSLWLRESAPSIIGGSFVGVLLGLCYAAVIIYFMRTSWVGAVTSVFLETHWTMLSCVLGGLAGLLISFAVIWFSIRRFSAGSTALLVKKQGTADRSVFSKKWKHLNWPAVIVIFMFAVALGVVGVFKAGDAQAGSFLGAGFLALVGGLISVYIRLKSYSDSRPEVRSVSNIGPMNLGRNLVKTMTSVSLIGISVFLIVAVSAFRLAPSDRGTAGCLFVAKTDIGIQEDLNKVKFENWHRGDSASRNDHLPFWIDGFRLHDGQQAGCNNPYQSHLPQVIGVSDSFVTRFDSNLVKKFAWASHMRLSRSDMDNPWRLLRDRSSETQKTFGLPNKKSINVVLDKNTAWYSLKVYTVGSTFEVDFPDAGKVTFCVVGLLDNSLLQGALLVSDEDFQRLFPQDDGSKFFLIWDREDPLDRKLHGDGLAALAKKYKDHGLSYVESEKHLGQFLAVQNTYLNAFQSLGALGLLLGTVGLVIAQYRSLLERTKEFAVFLALGFSRAQIRQMLTSETLVLLGLGFGVGVLGAAFCVFPHLVGGTASIPLLELAAVLVGITVIGVIFGLLMVRVILAGRLVDLLRSK